MRFQRYGSDLDLVEGVAKVANYVWDTDTLSWVRDTGGGAGGGGGEVTFPTLSKRYDFASETTLYIGEADPGVATSAPLWRIKRITFDANGNPTQTLFAGTGTALNVWDNRAGLSYS